MTILLPLLLLALVGCGNRDMTPEHWKCLDLAYEQHVRITRLAADSARCAESVGGNACCDQLKSHLAWCDKTDKVWKPDTCRWVYDWRVIPESTKVYKDQELIFDGQTIWVRDSIWHCPTKAGR